MRWDARGRLWVLCTWAYPQLKPGANRRMTSCSSSKTPMATRQADKIFTYADGLNMPTGFALGHGGAYIGNGRELLHVRDTTGDDDKADKRVVLLQRLWDGRHSSNHQLLRVESRRRIVFQPRAALLLARANAVGHSPSWTSTAHGDSDLCAANCTRTGAPPAAAIRGGLRLAIGASRLLKATATRASANCCPGWWPAEQIVWRLLGRCGADWRYEN